jgi:uncharacterized membrane protein YhaH (DUF805 family)
MERLGGYFSFNGRSSRLSFWRVQLVMLLIFAVLLIGGLGAAMAVGDAAVEVLPLLFLPIVAAFAWIYAANGVRRLHDRGKTGLWLVVFWGVPGLLGQVAKEIEKDQQLVLLGLLFSLISLGLSIWALVEIGLLAGQSGPNRFGDNPLMPTSEVFA